MKKSLVSLNKERHIYYKIENGRNDLPLDKNEKTQPVTGISSDDDPNKVIGMESKRKKPMEPFWDDGISEQSPKLPPVKRKKSKGSQFKLNFFKNIVFLSIASAILVGGAFGMMLLSLFTNNSENTTDLGVEQSTPQSQVQGVSSEGENEKFSVPAFDVFVAQGGAFTTEEKGKEMQNLLSEKGQPSVLMKEGDTQYLFMGVAAGKDTSEALGNYYQKQEMDTYMKSYAIYADQIEVEKPVHQFLADGVQWMKGATQISMNEIAGAQPTENEISQFQQLGAKWITSFKELPSQDETMNTLLKDWIVNSQAVMDVYSSNETAAPHAWEIQKSVLEGMIDYNAIVNQLES
ncbi:hypothetical protein [Salipaludibacillus sp. CF4.18]|uniref:hypothetical protein n=1 Tax=Salipaludibacillus sp. CF4.18 TaxID=3373081 RepID=UPI003EE693CF